MAGCVAKVAVAAARYWLDRPYDYLIPEELKERALPGCRVYVPFSRGNRRSEGLILAVYDHSNYDKLKSVTAVLDEKPVLTPEQIKLREKLHTKQVYYIIKKGDRASKQYSEPYQVASLEQVGKLSLAAVLQMPGSARSSFSWHIPYRLLRIRPCHSQFCSAVSCPACSTQGGGLLWQPQP